MRLRRFLPFALALVIVLAFFVETGVGSTDPNATIVSGPANGSTVYVTRTPVFGFTGNADTTSFECRVDTATYQACTSPFTTTTLTNGSHTFEVRALDAAGVPEASPDARAFTVNFTSVAFIESGVIKYLAKSGETNNVTVSSAQNAYELTDSGATFIAGPGCTLVYAGKVRCPSAGNSSILVQAGDGNDTVTASYVYPYTFSLPQGLEGGPGNDTLRSTSSNGINFISGQDGDDTMYNVMLFGAGYADSFSGGAGTDTVSYVNQSGSVAVSIDGAANDGAANEQDNVLTDVENVVGAPYGSDALTGSSGVNTLSGGGGNDVLDGRTGADSLVGGNGVDIAKYSDRTSPVQLSNNGTANDGETGEGDNIATDIETLVGGSANDLITGSSGTSYLVGGLGNDTFQSLGYDYADYSDRLTPVSASLDGVVNDGEVLVGEQDILGTGIDGIRGGSADDNLSGNLAFNFLYGNGGNDTLYGFAGTDELWGGAGNDFMDGGTYADKIRGEAGFDTISYADRTVPITVTSGDTTNNDGQSGENDGVQSDTEKIIGGSAADTITGSSLADTIDGGIGADVVNGLEGDDNFLVRDSIHDNVTCGIGNDNAVADAADTIAGDCETIDIEYSIDTQVTAGPADGGTVYLRVATYSFASDTAASFECSVDGATFAACTSPFSTPELANGSHQFRVRGLDAQGHADSTPATRNFGIEHRSVAYVDAGVLYYTDALGQVNDTTVNSLSNAVTITDTAISPAAGPGCATVSSTQVSCDSAGVTAISIGLGSGDDSITSNYTFGYPQYIDGGAGSDILSGTGSTSLRQLSGGDGNDTLRGGYPAPDVFSGGDGIDTVEFAHQYFGGVDVTIDGAADDGRPGEGDNVQADVENVKGTAYDDELSGSFAANVLVGSGGNDTFVGYGGSDTFTGGHDEDTVSYSDRTSSVTVSNDGDDHDGEESERDNVGSDVESLIGGAGNDSLTGGSGNDTITGGSGDDVLTGGAGADALHGESGLDTVDYSTRSEGQYLATGQSSGTKYNGDVSYEGDIFDETVERVLGGSGDDTIITTGQANVIDPGAGQDNVSSGAGDDTILTRDDTADAINCGADSDSTTADNGIDQIDASCESNDLSPVVTITSGPAESETVPNSQPVFTFVSEDASATFECGMDESAFEACSSPYSSPYLANGSHIFKIRPKDPNISAGLPAVLRSFNVSAATDPPETGIDSGPSDGAKINDPTPSFAFSSATGTGFECSVDGGAPVSCATPFTSGVLSDGSHAFSVRATRGTVADPTPVTRSFVVDTVAPSVVISSPSGPTSDSTPILVFLAVDANGIAATECEVDSVLLSECITNTELQPLSDGQHILQVIAADEAGNSGSSAVAFDIDTSQRDVSVRGQTLVVSTGDDVASAINVGYVGSSYFVTDAADGLRAGDGCYEVDAHRVECTDGEAINGMTVATGDKDDSVVIEESVPVGADIDLADGDDVVLGGAHSDRILAGLGDDYVDGGGGSDVFTGGDGNGNGGDGDDEFEGGDGAADEYRVISSGGQVSISQTDARIGDDQVADDGEAGEQDIVMPSIERLVGGPENDTFISFDESLEPGGVDRVLIGGDGDDVLVGANGDDALDGGDGNDRLTGNVGDDALNAGSGDDVLDGGEGADVFLGGGGEDTADYSDRGWPMKIVNGGGASNTSGGDSGTEGDAIEPGVERLLGSWSDDEIVGSDLAEQIDPGPGVDSVSSNGGDDELMLRDGFSDEAHCGDGADLAYVDEGDQVECDSTDNVDSVSFTSGPGEGVTTVDATPTFGFSGPSRGSAECRSDEETWGPCLSPVTTALLSDGLHTFDVRVAGLSGGPGMQATRSFNVDTTAPAIFLFSSPRGTVPTNPQDVEFATDGSEATTDCSLDGGVAIPCVSPYSFGLLDDGDHSLVISASDVSGNAGSTTVGFRVSSISPNTQWVDGALSIDLSAADGSRSVQISRQHGAYYVYEGSGGVNPGYGCVLFTATVLECDDGEGNYDPITITGGDFADSVVVDDKVTTNISFDGGLGSDQYIGGAGVDNVTGGSGDDTLDGGFGADFVAADDGDDSVSVADGEVDQVSCGSGSDGVVDDHLDELDGCETFQTRSVVLAVPSTSWPHRPEYRFIAAPGEVNDLVVSATSRSAKFFDYKATLTPGRGCSAAAHGTIRCAATSADRLNIWAGDRDDSVRVSPTSAIFASVYGEDGDDALRGGIHGGELHGGHGDDLLTAASDGDHLYGEQGNDQLKGSTEGDYLSGGDGNDRVDYSDRRESVFVTIGAGSNGRVGENDYVSGDIENVFSGYGDDVIVGSDTPNEINASSGDDTVDAGDGADVILARDGDSDSVTCGGGTDTIQVDALDQAEVTCEAIDYEHTTTIIDGPSDHQSLSDSTPAFIFVSDDAQASFECSIDDEQPSPCNSPFHPAAALAEGEHSFSVQAVQAQLPLGGPATRVFSIDTTTPAVSIGSGPENGAYLYDRTPVFSFGSVDTNAFFECSIDQGPFSTCSPPFEAEYDEGRHWFGVRAVDAAGNKSAPETRSFEILGGPWAEFTSAPDDDTHFQMSPPVFEFTSEEGETKECAIDGGEFFSCTSPYIFQSPYSGSRTFAVRAVDAAGNAGPPEFRSVMFDFGRTYSDTTAPRVEIDGGPSANSVVTSTPSFEFSANEPATFMCRVDDEEWQSCASPWQPTELSEGNHVVEVAATDLQGNFTRNLVERDFKYLPNSFPPAVEQAIETLEAVYPETLDAPLAIDLQEGSTVPKLPSTASSGSDRLVTEGTIVESDVSLDANGGFSVDTSEGNINVAPADQASDATRSTVVEGNAAIVGDFADGTDVVVKPSVSGLEIGALIKNTDAPIELSWDLNVGPGQFLATLSDGSVAVLGAPSENESVSDGDNDWVDPAGTSGPASSVYAGDVANMTATQASNTDSVLLVLSAPQVVDAFGTSIPSSFSIDGPIGRVTLKISTSGQASGPILASTRAVSNKVMPAAKSGRMKYFGVAGGQDTMFTDSPLKETLPRILDRFSGLASNPDGSIYRILVPWDAADDDECPAGSGGPPVVDASVEGTNPYAHGYRCESLWIAQRRILRATQWMAATGRSLHFYISPEPVHGLGSSCGKTPEAPDAEIPSPQFRTYFPCNVPMYIRAFDRMYDSLQSFVRRVKQDPGFNIEFWSSFNEPDQFKSINRKFINPKVAVGTWAAARNKINIDSRPTPNGSASTEGCLRYVKDSAGRVTKKWSLCWAVAGEFGMNTHPNEPGYSEIRRKYAGIINTYYGDDLPKTWSFHGYRDVGYKIERKHGSGTRKVRETDHGVSEYSSLREFSDIVENRANLRYPRIMMTEGGWNLKSLKPHKANTKLARVVKAAIAANRFLYYFRAGKRKYDYSGSSEKKLFKNVIGALVYQLQDGEGLGSNFDSSLFESVLQKCPPESQPNPFERTNGCATSFPRMRPFLCFLLPNTETDNCSGDNRPVGDWSSNEIEEGFTQIVWLNPTKHTAVLETRAPSFELSPDTTYKFKISYTVCSTPSIPSPTESCYKPSACNSAQCGEIGSASLPELRPEGSDFEYVIPPNVSFSDVVPDTQRITLRIDSPNIGCEPRSILNTFRITPVFSLQAVDASAAGAESGEESELEGDVIETGKPAVGAFGLGGCVPS